MERGSELAGVSELFSHPDDLPSPQKSGLGLSRSISLLLWGDGYKGLSIRHPHLVEQLV